MKTSNTENLKQPGPLLWDRVARIADGIDHFDKNESNLKILSCFEDIVQKKIVHFCWLRAVIKK